MHVINSPASPFYSVIPCGIHPGTTIQIDGHTPHHCGKFEVNLIHGAHQSWHHAHGSHVALKLKANVRKGRVVLNSRNFHDWGHKEKFHVSHFHRGQNFSLTITVSPNSYDVTINGQHFCNYTHRMSLQESGAIYIDGHVQLYRVEFREGYGGGYGGGYATGGSSYPVTSYPTGVTYPPPTAPIYGGGYMPPTIGYQPPPTVYIPPPQPPTTVIIDGGHDHHHHGGGLLDGIVHGIFGGGHHHDHHHHHGHHDYHHHHHH